MLHIRSVVQVLLLMVLTIAWVAAKQETTSRQFGNPSFGNGLGSGAGFGQGFGPGQGSGPGAGFGYVPPPQSGQAGCPLCDSSVYSYCSHKMVHDACCCDFPASAPAQLRPPQCLYYDCSLLYAKSCYEHALIKNCCCNSPY